MIVIIFFFFKQKTAYEMRISDWSSDVCSSDLQPSDAPSGRTAPARAHERSGRRPPHNRSRGSIRQASRAGQGPCAPARGRPPSQACPEARGSAGIGRASCRGQVGQYGEIPVVAVYLKKKYSLLLYSNYIPV